MTIKHTVIAGLLLVVAGGFALADVAKAQDAGMTPDGQVSVAAVLEGIENSPRSQEANMMLNTYLIAAIEGAIAMSKRLPAPVLCPEQSSGELDGPMLVAHFTRAVPDPRMRDQVAATPLLVGLLTEKFPCR